MEIGKVHDVVSLFSTSKRDFLIRNNGEKVKVDQSLKGKIVAILFLSLETSWNIIELCGESYVSRLTRSIKPVYDDLSPKNNFQVVLVADDCAGDESEDKELFDKLFSGMPWLAIPQDDKESRTKLFSMLGSELPPVCTILDDKGKIVNLNSITDLHNFGSECYPFTPERIIEIDGDDRNSRGAMSVKRFLTTPTRDFLIRSNFEKVPVSDLEGKVVAFYFSVDYESKTVDYLIELHKKLRQMGKQFEVVFLYSRGTEDERSFMVDLKKMPWLGLPFNDRSYLKLKRIFRCSEGDLVIVAPGEDFPDTFGLDVMRRYGIEAYPFTRRRVTEMEYNRLKSLTLESLLFSGRRKYIEGNSGQKIKADDLENKAVLLLFTDIGNPVCDDLVSRMITWYDGIKKTGKEDVEIIHISHDHHNPGKECNFGETPWLQFPCDARYEKLFRKPSDLYCSMPLLIAYGADGKILTMDIICRFISVDEEWESKIGYPFTHVDFYREVELAISRERMWPVTRDLIRQR